jgi:uncharacterized protein YceK
LAVAKTNPEPRPHQSLGINRNTFVIPNVTDIHKRECDRLEPTSLVERKTNFDRTRRAIIAQSGVSSVAANYVAENELVAVSAADGTLLDRWQLVWGKLERDPAVDLSYSEVIEYLSLPLPREECGRGSKTGHFG